MGRVTSESELLYWRDAENSSNERSWTVNLVTIRHYIITQVILAFWLVVAYDLLEDRRTIDVIIAKLFPRRFKMAESFEN